MEDNTHEINQTIGESNKEMVTAKGYLWKTENKLRHFINVQVEFKKMILEKMPVIMAYRIFENKWKIWMFRFRKHKSQGG